MAYKINKINIDLTLDLTEYIPGDGGKLDTNKKSPAQIFEWTRFTAQSADKLSARMKCDDLTNDETIMISRDALIDQIDWFYGKGRPYWHAIPFSCLREILEYLREQVVPATKK